MQTFLILAFHTNFTQQTVHASALNLLANMNNSIYKQQYMYQCAVDWAARQLHDIISG